MRFVTVLPWLPPLIWALPKHIKEVHSVKSRDLAPFFFHIRRYQSPGYLFVIDRCIISGAGGSGSGGGCSTCSTCLSGYSIGSVTGNSMFGGISASGPFHHLYRARPIVTPITPTPTTPQAMPIAGLDAQKKIVATANPASPSSFAIATPSHGRNLPPILISFLPMMFLNHLENPLHPFHPSISIASGGSVGAGGSIGTGGSGTAIVSPFAVPSLCLIIPLYFSTTAPKLLPGSTSAGSCSPPLALISSPSLCAARCCSSKSATLLSLSLLRLSYSSFNSATSRF